MQPISAVLITKDEEEHLPGALESVAFCDEVLVVDAGSSDRTVEVAKAHGARVLVQAPWPGFVAQRIFATGSARHDFVLALDADERVSPSLRAEIEALRTAGFGRDGYRIPRVARYLGRWVRGTDWYPDLQLRLFDRRRGRWEGAHVHESVRVQGTIGVLRGEIEHHPYANISEHLQRIDVYTSLWARQAFESGRKTGPLEQLGAPAWALLRNYLLRKGFLLGGVGLTISILNSYYTFVKLAKLEELRRGTN